MTLQQQQQQQALHIPLLGDERQCYDDDELNKEPESSTEKAVGTNDKDDVRNQLSYDAVFFSIAMPAFLFLQFAFAFSRQHVDSGDNETATTTATSTTTIMSWSMVNSNIGLFAAAVCRYRWACRDSRITNSFLLLLPEIMTNVVLVILVFDRMATAFVALLIGMQLMSVIALAVTAQRLYYSSNYNSCTKNNDVVGQEDEAKQVDIFIV
jgi:hypothetical protein